MPERGYQLRSSGALMCTLMSVNGRDGGCRKFVYLINRSFLCFATRCHPHVALRHNPACDAHEESMLAGRRCTVLMRLINCSEPNRLSAIFLHLVGSRHFARRKCAPISLLYSVLPFPEILHDPEWFPRCCEFQIVSPFSLSA